jgi:hypothetical protein
MAYLTVDLGFISFWKIVVRNPGLLMGIKDLAWQWAERKFRIHSPTLIIAVGANEIEHAVSRKSR